MSSCLLHACRHQLNMSDIVKYVTVLLGLYSKAIYVTKLKKWQYSNNY